MKAYTKLKQLFSEEREVLTVPFQAMYKSVEVPLFMKIFTFFRNYLFSDLHFHI